MANIGKRETKVPACPCRWNVVDSTGPLWAPWGILRLFRFLQNPLEKYSFRKPAVPNAKNILRDHPVRDWDVAPEERDSRATPLSKTL